MQTAEAKEIYKQRSGASERTNADVRTHRSMDRMLVRGVGKVLSVALWNAIVVNLMRYFALVS